VVINAVGVVAFGPVVDLGDPLVDSYLASVAGPSRPNMLRAVAHDLKTFLSVIEKDPVEVVAADIFDFVADQRGDRTVVGSPMASRGCRRARSPALVDLRVLPVTGRSQRLRGTSTILTSCRLASNS